MHTVFQPVTHPSDIFFAMFLRLVRICLPEMQHPDNCLKHRAATVWKRFLKDSII